LVIRMLDFGHEIRTPRSGLMAEDDAPLEPVAPEPVTEPADAAVTEPVPTATASGPPPWNPPPASAGTEVAPQGSGSSTVAVPKWLLLVVGALVIAGLGFAVGYAVAPDGDDADALRPNSGFVVPNPFDPDGGSPSSPTIPSPGPSEQGGAFLGVSTSRSTDPAGARVVRIVAGTPAADAGLETDDVITKVDDTDISNPTQLAREIQEHEDGDEVTITYVRDGATDTTDATLADRSSFQMPTPSTTRPRS
jgi:membrane-associated protease RseP (regulator of RpoE activity)